MTDGFGRRMSEVTNLTTSFKGPILSIAPVEIQVAPAHAEYPRKNQGTDQKSHSEGHTPEGGAVASGTEQTTFGWAIQVAQSTPCIHSDQTGNVYI